MEELAYGKETWYHIQKNFHNVKEVYLDHAGTTLYSKSCIEQVLNELKLNIFGNPHSHSPSSKHSSDLIDQIRLNVLSIFSADPKEYSVIFTSGATHGLKIVADSFRFLGVDDHELNSNQKSGLFTYLKESHTSVVGMRECFKKQVPCFALPTEEALLCLEQLQHCKSVASLEKIGTTEGPVDDRGNSGLTFVNGEPQKGNITCDETLPNSLFVFPAQCNFSGYKYPLELISAIQQGSFSAVEERFCLNPHALKRRSPISNWFCLLDAASFAGTNELDLSILKPDFVVISFYKIFGYPTGLGALIVHKRASLVLTKKYFGGGTVEMFSTSTDRFVPRESLHERFEDGTSNFLSIIALRSSIENYKMMVKSMDNVSRHTFFLAQYLYRTLRELKYSNEKSLVEVYSPTDFSDVRCQGGIVTFNLLRENGDYIGYSQVHNVLALFGIHVRTGCFCNPGACQRYLRLTDEEIVSQYSSGHKCGDENDLVDGRPTGAIRVSFGYMSTKKDVIQLVEVLRNSFLHETRAVDLTLKCTIEKNSAPQLIGIHVFPIKSCGAFSPTSWPITKAGLLFDRQWVIVNEAGAVITQKREPKLCLIKPKIDLSKNLLTLSYEGVSSVVNIPLKSEESADKDSSLRTDTTFTKVCGKVVVVKECDAVVSEWLSTVLQRPGLRLLRNNRAKNEETSSLANEASYLLINRNSALSLQQQLDCPTSGPSETDDFLMRFRGNFVIDGLRPFEEEQCELIHIGAMTFKNVGACYRCQMICVDQNTGARSQSPMISLAAYRGKKMPFGVQLELCLGDGKQSSMLRIGSPLLV